MGGESFSNLSNQYSHLEGILPCYLFDKLEDINVSLHRCVNYSGQNMTLSLEERVVTGEVRGDTDMIIGTFSDIIDKIGTDLQLQYELCAD